MERTDEVADQSACRESDQSVNQESVKGVKDYFERFFTDRKELPAEKDGRKCRVTEGYCSLCVSALQPKGHLLKSQDNYHNYKRHPDTKHKTSQLNDAIMAFTAQIKL